MARTTTTRSKGDARLAKRPRPWSAVRSSCALASSSGPPAGGWSGRCNGMNEPRDSAPGVPSSERVYRGLRHLILTGALPPVARLIELQLAQQFDVSRTPVREALARLTAEGLAVADPVRGLVVRDVDPAEVED